MALDLYRVSLGLAIDEDDGTEAGHVLSGGGAPGGDGAEQDDAPVGSIFLRTDASSTISVVYQKITDTDSTSDWVQSASKDYVDNLVNGLSWREPVLVRDNTTYADITAAETAANVGDTVDGVTITVGDRLLFTDLTTGNENVYEVSGSSGNWTFTEDSNAATDGDAVLVQQGTSADQQWVYDGTNWVQFGGASSNAELGFIRTFIGKTAAGSETPTYSSTNIVTSGDSLEAAIGDLDAAMGDQTYTEQNYVTNGQTFTASIDALDINLQDAFDAIGDRTYTEQNFVTDGESLTDSIDALDIALGDVTSLETSSATGITTATTVDTVSVDDVRASKWFVYAFDEGDPTQVRAEEVYAVHDGTASADATEVDWNRASRLRLNGNIAGFDIDVVLAGTGASQTMGLQLSASDTITVYATRLDVFSV
jgi:hypothetical protein